MSESEYRVDLLAVLTRIAVALEASVPDPLSVTVEPTPPPQVIPYIPLRKVG